MPRPFRFGAGEISVASREEWVDFARKVEALGYSTLMMGDHPGLGGLGQIAGLMAAAEATTTLRLSSLFANDLRNPVMLAQDAAALDLLSDGRLEFGIGSGWLARDYWVCGVPFDPPPIRIGRLEEAVPLIKRLFEEESVTFTGAYYQVEEASLQHKPKQRPRPPLFVGGGGRRVLTLAAREADIVGFDPKGTAAGTKDLATTTAEGLERQVDWVREAAGERFPDLEFHILVFAAVVTDDRRHGAEQVAAMLASFPPHVVSNAPTAEQVLDWPQVLIGTVDQIAEDLQARRERFGISYYTVFGDSAEALAPVVARLAGR